MTSPHSVGIFVGSLRKEAYSRRIATWLKSNAPASLVMNIVEIGALPLYDPDLDDGVVPVAWTRFREAVAAVDAVLFVTPEYNRSVPAALKNALDVGSRPYGASVWAGKPGAVVSVSPGGIGGFGANHHLRQSLVFLDVPTLQQPEVYLGHVDRLFDLSGDLTDENTHAFLTAFLAAFAAWTATNLRR
ncbi:NAD(P)H-dependent oxidoreductase [Siculibacillus lacustris]|uniref:NAD(P)H-dependent oxidoreductase n=1 Tax=Siculibacillus lacustris TaxID=1549641 RepID=A0A4Q9VMF7_9HYPH|nr:NAD(P)H-dependent oxidoreductase [Siculibacillus lacustris]TBW36783.1 NAD(P)H-dependent oxidoreductase [Siculibacillus lacustris]